MSLALALLFGFPASAQDGEKPALMPLPTHVVVNSSPGAALSVSGPFTVVFDGYSDDRLEKAAARFRTDAGRLTGFPGGSVGPRLTVSTRADALSGRLGAAEGYQLIIDEAGVRLIADGPDGVLRGLATLRQLVELRGANYILPFAQIEDAPRFAWRGVMIDTVRHFVEFDTLKRQIDAMERVKLNVLHMHISDNEGFRVESLSFPRLTEVASGGQFYTQAQVRELVAYAADRGVRIVPEIDVPAHTGAIMTAYPELAAGPFDPKDRRSMFTAAIDPTKPQTYTFIRELLREMSGLFPDAYFHVGGDEVAPTAWMNNPEIRAFMKARGYADTIALQDYFFGEVHAIVRSLGKTTMGWEEVAHQPIDDSTVVQAWRSSQATTHITAQGNPVVVSAGYYLDLLWQGLDHYGRDPQDVRATPPDSPEKVLGPAPLGDLTPEQAALVIGAEAPLWSETVSDEMVDGRLWPRAALLAERFWSAADVRDPLDAARRAVIVQEGLRRLGLRDAYNRHSMAARLSPADAETVETLASIVTPVHNMGRLAGVFAALRAGKPTRLPDLNAFVDVSAPDSIELYQLMVWADAASRGDQAATIRLSAALAGYRDNHPRFVVAAGAVEELKAAIPASEDAARLAVMGLEALDFLQRGEAFPASWRAGAETLLARHAEARAASSTVYKIIAGVPQPPALVLMGLAPVVERLIADPN